MAFKSDGDRTWDPDAGWELRRIPTMPETVKFELIHPTEKSIRFQGNLAAVEAIDQRDASGRQMVRKVYRIFNVNGPAATATEAQKQLIHDALYAFGVIYDGPCGPVDVSFV